MRFGIEIEFIANGRTKGQIAAAIRRTGAKCYVEGYNHNTRPHWKIVTDVSCDLELVSPPLEGDRGLEEVKKVLMALERTGVKIRKTCGFHVHHDASQLTLDNFKNLFKNWIGNEDIFDALLPISRRENNNQYCRSLRNRNADIDSTTTVRELYDEVANSNRYFKLNLGSYFRHRTIEFRHHSGTVEWQKVLNWVKLTHCFIQQSINNPIPARGSFIERFNAIFQSNAVSIPTQMKAQKELAYNLLGVNNTKAVKQWAKQQELNVDLRTKAGWQAVLERLIPQQSASDNLIDLRQFYAGRMRQLNTIHLLEAA